jgi:MFS family permease
MYLYRLVVLRTNPWQLMIFRFLAALGIGGEWAVGALISGAGRVNGAMDCGCAADRCQCGVLGAGLANFILAAAPRWLFLVGILPALLVLWIRRAVPETDAWRTAKSQVRDKEPRLWDLFTGETRHITIWVTVVCGISLTAHWAFMFWHQQHLRNLPEVLNWTATAKNKLASEAMYLVMVSSIVGNFFAAWLSSDGYRAAIAALFWVTMAMIGAYGVVRDHNSLLWWFPLIGFARAPSPCSRCASPLFPTLLRTTGAGFSYNIGRITAAFGTVFFGLFSNVGDYRSALFTPGSCSFRQPLRRLFSLGSATESADLNAFADTAKCVRKARRQLPRQSPVKVNRFWWRLSGKRIAGTG